jgi:Flp pilus assembly protein TadD
MEDNPNEATWQIEIGNTLALKGDLSNALVHLQVATLMEPDSWTPWQSLATFCITYNYQISTTGLEAARKALLLVPGSPVLLDIMGSAYMVTGDLDSAERFFLQALQAAPKQAEILFHLGQVYLQENKKEQAFSYLREAADNATDSRIRDNANLLIQQSGGE